MSRGVVIALIGAAAIIIAVLLNLEETRAPEVVEASAPSAAAPAATAPEAPAAAAAPQTAAIDPSAADASAAAEPPDAETAPRVDGVRVGPDGETVLAGVAAPGSRVTVTVDGAVVGAADADSRGEWVIIPDRPVPAGDRTIGLSSLSEDGEAKQSESVVVVSRGEDGERPLAVLTSPDAPGETRVLQSPGGGESGESPASAQTATTSTQTAAATTSAPTRPARPGLVTIEGVDYDQAGAYVVSGRAGPGAQLQIYRDNRAVGTTIAGEDGRWSFAPDELIDVGVYTIRADALTDGA
ncbi:MAG: hypothetical protein AAF684_04275, partial [Pseudomonadota bacterium]